ncbi:MAG: hypothetical protein AAGA48_30585 [Myxococcota bacterium]
MGWWVAAVALAQSWSIAPLHHTEDGTMVQPEFVPVTELMTSPTFGVVILWSDPKSRAFLRAFGSQCSDHCVQGAKVVESPQPPLDAETSQAMPLDRVTCHAQLAVQPDGRVGAVRVDRCQERLAQLAYRTLKNWDFKPTGHDDVVITKAAVTFLR